MLSISPEIYSKLPSYLQPDTILDPRNHPISQDTYPQVVEEQEAALEALSLDSLESTIPKRILELLDTLQLANGETTPIRQAGMCYFIFRREDQYFVAEFTHDPLYFFRGSEIIYRGIDFAWNILKTRNLKKSSGLIGKAKGVYYIDQKTHQGCDLLEWFHTFSPIPIVFTSHSFLYDTYIPIGKKIFIKPFRNYSDEPLDPLYAFLHELGHVPQKLGKFSRLFRQIKKKLLAESEIENSLKQRVIWNRAADAAVTTIEERNATAFALAAAKKLKYSTIDDLSVVIEDSLTSYDDVFPTSKAARQAARKKQVIK
jgi:hypothetical protein